MNHFSDKLKKKIRRIILSNLRSYRFCYNIYFDVIILRNVKADPDGGNIAAWHNYDVMLNSLSAAFFNAISDRGTRLAVN